MNLQQSITTALGKDIGTTDALSPGSYDVGKLSSVVKDRTVKVLIPQVQNNDFLHMLEDGSDGSKFLQRCLQWSRGGGHLFSFFASGEESEKRRISASDLLGQVHDPAVFETAVRALEGLSIFSGDLVRLDKAAMAWTHKKLIGYVGEFWQSVNRDKVGFGKRFLEQMMLSQEYLTGVPMNTQKEISLSGIYITAVLAEYSRDIQTICSQDPQFEMWKQTDQFFHPNRFSTKNLGNDNVRVVDAINTGIAAGLDFATGCLSVAVEKCQGDRRSALMLFENSVKELLLTQGVMDLSYIGMIAEIARHPSLIQELCLALEKGEYSKLGDIARKAKMKRLDFMAEALQYQTNGDQGSTIRMLVDFESKHPFIPELFEISDGSTLRICPWFTDFIKLINARIKESKSAIITTLRCPMMHGKVNGDAGFPVTFMEDFGKLVAHSIKQYWGI